jgi:hypothetical protein
VQLLLGVVDQHRQIDLALIGQLAAEGLVDLAPDRAGRVAQDVVELLIGAMDIRDVVIGALWQRQNGVQVNHLDMRGGDGRVALAEQLEQP